MIRPRAAAVVGVVLNLAVWFSLRVIYPGDGTLDFFAILVGAVAFVGMVGWKSGYCASGAYGGFCGPDLQDVLKLLSLM